jgi:guanidinopropionase
MDQDKLAKLWERYAGASGADIHDPRFAKVAAGQFQGDRRKWPFSDVATFINAPYRPDALSKPDLGGLDIAIIGLPMDLGVTNRAGTRLGPRAVRAVERMGPMDHVNGTAPFNLIKAADIGDVPFRSRYSLESCHEDIEATFKQIVKAGVSTLGVGGDHSITYPILKAVGEKRPVGMVHIDAHCDTSGPYEGSKFHHGGPFRQAVLDGVLDPERVIQIGIRGGAEYLWEFSYESGMTVIHADEGRPHGPRRRHRQGARGDRRRTDLCLLRRRFARSRLRSGTGTPESVASPRARRSPSCAASRGRTSSPPTWSRSRRNTTRPATRRNARRRCSSSNSA